MTYLRRAILALALIAGITPAIAQVPAPVPALPDTERRTSYTISGTTCACNVNFALYGDSTDYANWLEVWLNGAQQIGNWTITSPSGQLSSLARPITDAVLTFTTVQTGSVQIVGARRPRRASQYNEGTGVPTRNFNRDLTDIIAQNRELWDKTNDMTGRGVFAPPGETMNPLPPASQRASQGVCFDSGGNLVPCLGIPAGSIAAGNGITFTGTNPTTIANNIAAGAGINITGTNPKTIAVSCVPSPSNCVALFGYVNPLWYGALCDGATDDTAAFATALLAAKGKVFSFPAGAVCVVQHFDVCSNPTCQTGRTGANVPLIIEGNGATLLAPSSISGQATFVYVEMQTATNIANFVLRDLIINAGGFASRGLTVVGCVYCSFVNIGESGAEVIGCHFNAMVGFVLANSLIERVNCNTNNTNSGTQGVGLLEDTTATWLGSSSCASNAQNAGNTFISVHTLFNGFSGWQVFCANNAHISPDMEQNLSYGLSITAVTASEWIGAQFSSNRNSRGSAGTGGDASVINNDGSPGIQFFGGASDGTFTSVNAAHGDTLAMQGQTGFGFTTNCNSSGHACMTLP